MAQRRIRRAAVAVATVLALAAPVQAAGRRSSTAAPGWFVNAQRWIVQVWRGDAERGRRDPTKSGWGVDPNGDPVDSNPLPPAIPSDPDPVTDPNG